MENTDLAWLAGFWDGEGCVTTLKHYAIPQFVIGQAGDEGAELCQRVLDIAELGGHVHGPYLHGGRKKPYYVARITGGAAVIALLEKCGPWLSRTKREQAEAALQRWKQYRINNNVVTPGEATHCRRGHEWTPENTQWSPPGAVRRGRRCRACHRENEARRRARKKLDAARTEITTSA